MDQSGIVYTAQVDQAGRLAELRKSRIDIGEILVSAEVALGSNGEIVVYAIS